MSNSMLADGDRGPDPSPTVLVIDDHEGVRDSIAAVLEADGFRVVVAADGDQGLSAFHAARPDAVITDIVMPVKDGIEVIREIRRERQDVGIVAITGGPCSGNATLRTIAVEVGADAGLLKPFDPEHLVDALRAALQRHRAGAK